MALVNLTTSLKNLKYGKDKPGGGESNQPYIRTSISQGSSLPKGGPDSILRGGILTPLRVVNDTSRITQMFGDLKSPTGILFTSKQNLLSRTSVKTEASFGSGYGGGNINQGVYLPTSTIAQTNVGFTGTHLNLLGLDPSSPMRGDKQGLSEILGLPTIGLHTYEEVQKAKQQLDTPLIDSNTLNSSYNNRLLRYWNIHITKKSDGPLDTYSGGPGSILGVGNTILPFSQRTGINNSNIDNRYIIPENENISIRKGATELDFRTKKVNETTKYKTLNLAPNYKTFNFHRRTNLGDAGVISANKTENPYRIKAHDAEALDKINALPLYESEGDKPVNDLVKFRIASISNKDPNRFIYMHFRALIDSFNDSYTANWNSTYYVGRGEPFYNYLNFDRGIDLAFTVAAQSKAELIPMYQKLNFLASTLTPEYSESGFMMGNLVRLTLGGYLHEQPGIITSLNYNIPEDSPWEIGINETGGYDDSVKELPHIIKVTGFRFIPIYNFLPQKVDEKKLKSTIQRYISLSNNNTIGNYDNDKYPYTD